MKNFLSIQTQHAAQYIRLRAADTEVLQRSSLELSIWITPLPAVPPAVDTAITATDKQSPASHGSPPCRALSKHPIVLPRHRAADWIAGKDSVAAAVAMCNGTQHQLSYRCSRLSG